ncbi:MAG: class I SAM-dependent methyltransferase [Eubacteriales bacterium]|nr:class I SAM-dependent methyltransferase [Eubacteriales bacterium]
MQLSKRLSAVASMVTEGNRLVDVGCDHGYLPLYLYLNKKIPSAIAMDVRPGPLSRAREHIAEYGLEKYIETRLSDGLSALSPGEGDTLTVAGMGGPLMERILMAKEEVRESFQELILQPQSDIPHFRRFLREIGWEIIEEEIVLEDGKFYPMMKAVRGEAQIIPEDMPYTPEEAFGGLLLKKRHPVLKLYLERELRIRNRILEKLREAAADDRRKEIEEERSLILAALEQYESI